MSSKYCCPACHFTIFNRRVARCEKCKAELPETLLFTEQDLARLAIEEARIAKQRQELERQRAEEERRRELGRWSGG